MVQVLTMEWVEGVPLAKLSMLSAEERRRVGPTGALDPGPIIEVSRSHAHLVFFFFFFYFFYSHLLMVLHLVSFRLSLFFMFWRSSPNGTFSEASGAP